MVFAVFARLPKIIKGSTAKKSSTTLSSSTKRKAPSAKTTAKAAGAAGLLGFGLTAGSGVGEGVGQAVQNPTIWLVVGVLVIVILLLRN